MKFKYIGKVILAGFLLLFFLSGCVKWKLYEKSGFILQVGIETGIDDKYLFSYTLPVILDKEENLISIITAETDLIFKSREETRLESGKMLEGGKVQHMYFSDEIAEKGIHSFFDVWCRNPETPILANIIVVDGSPNEMFEKAKEFKDKPRPAFYVSQLLEHARESNYTPETRAYRYIISYCADGIDPIASRIKLKENAIEVAGSALFVDDRMVGKLDTPQTSLLLTLMNNKSNFHYFYKKDKKEENALWIKDSKNSIDIKLEDEIPIININIKFKAELDEHVGFCDFSNNEVVKEHEDEIEKSIKKQYENIFKYLQKTKSDPIGIGNMIRVSYNSYWDKIDWRKVYGKAKINIEVDVKVEKYGSIN